MQFAKLRTSWSGVLRTFKLEASSSCPKYIRDRFQPKNHSNFTFRVYISSILLNSFWSESIEPNEAHSIKSERQNLVQLSLKVKWTKAAKRRKKLQALNTFEQAFVRIYTSSWLINCGNDWSSCLSFAFEWIPVQSAMWPVSFSIGDREVGCPNALITFGQFSPA